MWEMGSESVLWCPKILSEQSLNVRGGGAGFHKTEGDEVGVVRKGVGPLSHFVDDERLSWSTVGTFGEVGALCSLVY